MGYNDEMRLTYIDALKGIAILGVILFHTSSYSSIELPHLITMVLNQGARGVQLFFILTAVTLSYSWDRYSDTFILKTKRFYWRRWLSLGLPYYLVIIFWLVTTAPTLPIYPLLSVGLFLNAWSPTLINFVFPGSWFIPVVMFFILIFPWIRPYFQSISRGLLLTLISMICCQLLRIYLLNHSLFINESVWSDFTFIFPLSQLPVFLMGLTLYQLLIRSKLNNEELKYIRLFIVVICTELIIQVMTGLKLVAGHYLFGLVFCAITLFLSKFPISFIVNRFTASLGKMSYGLYLLHMIVLYWLAQWRVFDIDSTYPLIPFSIRFLVLLGTSSLLLLALTSLYRYVFAKIHNFGIMVR